MSEATFNKKSANVNNVIAQNFIGHVTNLAGVLILLP